MNYKLQMMDDEQQMTHLEYFMRQPLLVFSFYLLVFNFIDVSQISSQAIII
jgi:hypothetical protein